MIKSCEICGKEFKIKPSHYHLRKTCSRNCKGCKDSLAYQGEGNPAYGRTYCTKAQNPEWAENISLGTAGKINLGSSNGMKQQSARNKVSDARKIIMQDSGVRQKISEQMKSAWASGKFDGVRVGQCKWYEHIKPDGTIVKVQGTWERSFVEWADKQGLSYICHKGRIPYIDEEGRQRSYYPDFFVEEWDCWVDVKNDYHFGLQRGKFLMIEKSNPNLKLKILCKQELDQLGIFNDV